MIIRAVHNRENPYFMMRRLTAQDARLPARALGVLAYLMSKPDTWEPTIEDICRRFPDIGKNQAYKIINEIFIPLGYARRVKERANGKICRWVTEIYESPVTDFGEVENPENRENSFPENREEFSGSPVPQNREVETSSRLPDDGFGEHRYYRRENTDLLQEENTDLLQQQPQAAAASNPARLPAAANTDFGEPHSSAFAFAEVEDFVRETKPHIRNPGGMARKLWRSGEEDAQIEQWRKPRDEIIWPKWVFDPKEPGTIEEKKRLHLQLCEAQRRAEAEALAFNQQPAAGDEAA